jgi:hypothetical protein
MTMFRFVRDFIGLAALLVTIYAWTIIAHAVI